MNLILTYDHMESILKLIPFEISQKKGVDSKIVGTNWQ